MLAQQGSRDGSVGRSTTSVQTELSQRLSWMDCHDITVRTDTHGWMNPNNSADPLAFLLAPP